MSVAFEKGDKAFSRILSGDKTHMNKWVPCTIMEVNEDGTYKLEIHDAKKYRVYPYADRVAPSLLLKELPDKSLASPKHNEDQMHEAQGWNDAKPNKEDDGSGNPPAVPALEEEEDKNDQDLHPLFKVDRYRGGSWDKVAHYWGLKPDVCQAVREQVVLKARKLFKNYQEDIDALPWKAFNLKSEVFKSAMKCKTAEWPVTSFMIKHEIGPREDIDPLKLERMCTDDNYMRARPGYNRNGVINDFEVIDHWTDSKPGLPDVWFQIKSEVMKLPFISDRFTVYYRAVLEIEDGGYVGLTQTIVHPLKKKRKGCTRGRFLYWDIHTRREDGGVNVTSIINMDLGGMVPGKVISWLTPQIIKWNAEYILKYDFDFTDITDWEAVYEKVCGPVDESKSKKNKSKTEGSTPTGGKKKKKKKGWW